MPDPLPARLRRKAGQLTRETASLLEEAAGELERLAAERDAAVAERRDVAVAALACETERDAAYEGLLAAGRERDAMREELKCVSLWMSEQGRVMLSFANWHDLGNKFILWSEHTRKAAGLEGSDS